MRKLRQSYDKEVRRCAFDSAAFFVCSYSPTKTEFFNKEFSSFDIRVVVIVWKASPPPSVSLRRGAVSSVITIYLFIRHAINLSVT